MSSCSVVDAEKVTVSSLESGSEHGMQLFIGREVPQHAWLPKLERFNDLFLACSVWRAEDRFRPFHNFFVTADVHIVRIRDSRGTWSGCGQLQ